LGVAKHWSFRRRVGLLCGFLALGLAGLLLVPPIPQDPAYHLFADSRGFMGIPNFANVASNFPFLLVGVVGLIVVCGRQDRAIFQWPEDRRPYAVFFFGVALVSLGSAYYHWEPGNESLFWDRLPMTVAFMGLSAGILADRGERRFALTYLLPLMVLAGIASLIYWDLTERAGAGDLRFYGFVQFFPIVALPLVFWLFPKAHYAGTRGLLWVVFYYVLAKILEHLDSEIFMALGGLVSGHSLKHLAAAVATLMVLPMLLASRRLAVT